MLQIFNNNRLSTATLFCLYALVLLLPSWFVHGINTELLALQRSTSLAAWLTSFFGDSLVLASFLFFVFVCAQALLLNSIVQYFRLSRRNNYYVALAYILLLQLIPDRPLFTGTLWAGFFLSVSFWSLCNSQEHKGQVGSVFNSGFFLSLALLCQPLFWIYIPLWFWTLLRFRSPDWREYMIFSLGLANPVFLAFTYYYLSDSVALWYEQSFVLPFGVSYSLAWNAKTYALVSVFSFVYIFGLAQASKLKMKMGLREQKAIQGIVNMLLLSPLLLYIAGPVSVLDFEFLLVPFALLLGLVLQQIQSSILAETIHFALFALIFLLHFGQV